VTVTAAMPAMPDGPAGKWDTSSAGRGWDESKVVRDHDPGQEGQFDFKDPSKEKAGKAAASKAASEANKRASEARSAEAKKAQVRRAAAAMARRTTMRNPGDVQADIDDLTRQIQAAASAHGSADYPGRADDERRLAMLHVELQDATLGNNIPIAQRIALREHNLADARNQGVSADIIEALTIDLDTFKSLQSEVEAAQVERAKKAQPKAPAPRAARPTGRSVAPVVSKQSHVDPAAERERLRLERKKKRELQQHREARNMEHTAQKLQAMAAAGKEWNAEQRKEAAVKGYALPDGSYPIKTKSDWYKARQALGRAKERAPVIRHLKKRAKALGIPASEMENITAAAPPVAVDSEELMAELRKRVHGEQGAACAPGMHKKKKLVY